MAVAAPRVDLAAALTFREVRWFLRRSRAVPVAVFFGILYALGSLLWGGMLSLVPLGGGTTVEVLTGSGTGQGWWNYPGVLVVAPWGVLALPFFATFTMVVVAVAVGLGMAVAAALIVRLVRPSPAEVARSKAVGAATGLTPAMLALVTLGSCCTTTAAATGGIGMIANASGTSTANVLLNNWYLGVAQIAIVWSALFGQELLLTVYGGLLGLRPTERSGARVAAPPFNRAWVAGATLRTLLVVGGVLWSLSMFAEWTTRSPFSAGAGWWFNWVVQHQLIAGLAAGTAFFPVAGRRLATILRTGNGRIVGAAVVLAALSLLVWLPPPLPAWGLDSLTGQLLGVLGAPVSWGAIPVGQVSGLALYLRWGLEYVLPAGFVLTAVLAPERAFAPLLATVAAPSREPALGESPFLAAAALGGAAVAPEVRG
jgi:hypothetical protein